RQVVDCRMAAPEQKQPPLEMRGAEAYGNNRAETEPRPEAACEWAVHAPRDAAAGRDDDCSIAPLRRDAQEVRAANFFRASLGQPARQLAPASQLSVLERCPVCVGLFELFPNEETAVAVEHATRRLE